MKRLPMLATPLVLFTLTACGGDSSPTGINGNTNVGDGTMSAAINGVAWRSLKSGDKGSHSGQIYAIAIAPEVEWVHDVPYAVIVASIISGLVAAGFGFYDWLGVPARTRAKSETHPA